MIQTSDDERSLRRLVWNWLIGILGSWACVWLMGPWLVNSILIRVHDRELAAITLREGDLVHWRSEGWASTRVGPHGRPGWKPNQAARCIVIWGDSQVEGFCVNDSEKINNQIIGIAHAQNGESIDCIPMGRSGSNATDWNRMLANVDKLWQPTAHVWIVTELADLLALSSDEDVASGRWNAESPHAVLLAKQLHADAAFHAIRNLVLDPTSGTNRALRWSVGPVRGASQENLASTVHDNNDVFSIVVERLRLINKQLNQRLIIVYAPSVPRIMGAVLENHPDDSAWEAIAALLTENSIDSIDMRAIFNEQYQLNKALPRGFHNGTPGYGHLNAVGNRLIAAAIVERHCKRPQP